MLPRDLIYSAEVAGRSSLSEADGKSILAEAGIAIPKSVVAATAEEAQQLVKGMSPPFAVKVMAADILP